MLAGCGNDDKPTPAPTASPTEAPTPTPSTSAPSPTPTYAKVSDLSENKTFASACLIGSPGSINLTYLDEKPNISYEAGTQTWTFHEVDADNGFTPADRLNPAAPMHRKTVTTPSGSATETLFFNSIAVNPPEYVASSGILRDGIGWQNAYACISGSPTLTSDMPALNELAYSGVNLTGSGAVLPIDAALSNVQIDPTISSFEASLDGASGKILITMALKARNSFDFTGTGPVTDLGTFTGTVEIDASQQRFDGDLHSDKWSDGSLTVSGWFFGPQATEMAFNFFLNGSTGMERLQGTGKVFAKR